MVFRPRLFSIHSLGRFLSPHPATGTRTQFRRKVTIWRLDLIREQILARRINHLPDSVTWQVRCMG
jgi:hypothetical protein